MKDWKFHCAVLGVRESASAEEVRRAYRRLALERHPDKHSNSLGATEDFQQLNESYRHLISGLSEERNKEVPTPSPASMNVDQDAPTNPNFRAPLSRPATAAKPFRTPPSKGGYRKIWLHAVATCSALLALSLWAELHNPSPPGNRRDHSPLSWCRIAKGASNDDKADLFEYWPQNVCQEHCLSLTQKNDVLCSWNSVVFRGAKPADLPIKVAERNGDLSCVISVEREEGKSESTPYTRQSEASCLKICVAMADPLPRAGIHCLAGGREIFQQPLFHPPPETEPHRELAAAEQNDNIPIPDSGEDRRDTCFMTVVLPGDARSSTIPGDTSRACETRCYRAHLEHPLDGVIECAFAGKTLNHFVPDPLTSYLARNPSQGTQGVQMGNTFFATCEIYGTLNGERKLAWATPADKKACETHCRYEFSQAPAKTHIACNFGGNEIFSQDAQ